VRGKYNKRNWVEVEAVDGKAFVEEGKPAQVLVARHFEEAGAKPHCESSYSNRMYRVFEFKCSLYHRTGCPFRAKAEVAHADHPEAESRVSLCGQHEHEGGNSVPRKKKRKVDSMDGSQIPALRAAEFAAPLAAAAAAAHATGEPEKAAAASDDVIKLHLEDVDRIVEVEVDEFAHSFVAAAAAAPAAASCAVSFCRTFHHADVASLRLAGAAIDGAAFRKASFELARKGAVLYTVRLENARVGKYEVVAAAGSLPQEKVALQCDSLSVSFPEADDEGNGLTGAGESQYSWRK